MATAVGATNGTTTALELELEGPEADGTTVALELELEDPEAVLAAGPASWLAAAAASYNHKCKLVERHRSTMLVLCTYSNIHQLYR